MNSFVGKLVFAAAVVIAPLPSIAGPLRVFPAPVHLMNLSPAFNGYSDDLTLLSLPLTENSLRLRASVPTFSPPRRSGANESKRVEVVKKADAANFRFDARVPNSPLGLLTPQAIALIFQSNGGWSFRKLN